MAPKKSAATKKSEAKSAPKSMPKAGKNPKGGLTQAGREFFAKRDGSRLKPGVTGVTGVTGAADTPDKMKRKGSFLVRTFSHPRGPMLDPKGEPTRLALSAHAWGEPVPKTISAAHKLAAKGHTLLSKYHDHQDKAKAAAKAAKSAAKQTGRLSGGGAKKPGKTASKPKK